MAGPLPPSPQTVRINIFGTSSELNWANVLHALYAGAAPSSTSCSLLANAIYGALLTNMIPLMTTDQSIDGVIVTDIASDTGNTGEAVGATVGTSSAPPLPASVAVLANYEIARRYRGGHPRSYVFCGGQTDLQDQSTWAADFIDDVQASWAAVLASIISTYGGTSYTNQANVSYVNEGSRRDTPVRDVILAMTVSPRIASQRRRMRRRT